MTRERLQSFSLEELKRIARQEGLDPDEGLDHQGLLEVLLEAFQESRREREQESSLPILGEERKFELSRDEEIETSGVEEFPLPPRYNETRVVLLVRDSHWAYAYWDIEDNRSRSIRTAARFETLVLRIRSEGEVLFDNANRYFDIPVQLSDSSWYIYLPHPDCAYTLELGYVAGGKYNLLCCSKPVRTPRGTDIAENYRDEGLDGIWDATEQSLRLSLEAASSETGIPQRIISLPREPIDE